jgi:membrane protease YdiL (CAAX protease family)
MSDTTLSTSRQNALLTWLRYDPKRIPDVEAAYDEFISTSKYGVAIFASIIASLVAVGIASLFEPRALGHLGPVALIVGSCTFYGIQLFSLRAVPKETLATVLSGAVDGRRAVIFGVVCSLAILLAEFGIGAILAGLHVVENDNGPDPLAMGLVFGFFLAVIVAPVAEEFMMQGWLQTRLRGLGPRGAAVATTCVFLLMHAPTSPFAVVRVILLGSVAAARGSIRSLGTVIAMHVVNNLAACVFAIYAPAVLHLK